MLPDYVNSKLVAWSIKLVSLASTLLRLFGTEFLALAFRLLCTVAWPFVSYYKLGQVGWCAKKAAEGCTA